MVYQKSGDQDSGGPLIALIPKSPAAKLFVRAGGHDAVAIARSIARSLLSRGIDPTPADQAGSTEGNGVAQYIGAETNPYRIIKIGRAESSELWKAYITSMQDFKQYRKLPQVSIV